MKKFKFLKISKTKKLRYISNYYKKNLYIIFLPGFASDIEGDKPKRFLNYAKKNKFGFLALEYSGYGKSSGEFTKGNISTWANDAKQTIKNIVKKNDIILIGSSMGAWISLLLFKSIKKQIKGFMGIGSAPEFLTRIMWKKFSKKTKSEIIKKGICKIKNGGWIICLPTPFRFPRNKVSYQPTSDSPTFSRRHLAVGTSAGATLSPWEGLFRHTASPRRERKF